MEKGKIYFLAFVEGLVVIILELLGKNVLCPHFGNSLTVWTVIIGNTFLFLSIGYYFSYRFFRKSENKKERLSFLLFLITCLTLLLPVFSKIVIPIFAESSIYLGAVMSHLIIFGPVFVLCGFLNPGLILILDEEKNNLGNASAKVFFVSTLGGVLGCLILAINLSKDIEISYLLIAVSFVLLLSAGLLETLKIRQIVTASLLFFYCLFFNPFYVTRHQEMDILFHSNTPVGDLKVYDVFDSSISYKRRMLSVNNIPQTSIVNDPNIYSTWNYVHRISIFASLKRNGDGLLVGMGGGTIASELQKLNLNLTIIDIDKRMFEVANHFFYHHRGKSKIIVDDARYYLNKKHQKKYDLLVFDVLNGESQPNNLFTVEGFAEMKNCLKRDGLIIIEFQELRDEQAIAYKSICNTILASGMNVYVSVMGDDVADFVILASETPLDLSLLDPKKFTNNLSFVNWLPSFFQQPAQKIKEPFENAIVLYDDLPILDKYCERTRMLWRKNYLESAY